jgi:hypothetical protein
MSCTRFAAVTVAVSILCCGAVEAGGPLRVFKQGFWSGGAYTDDRTGVFSHCSAGVAYDSGINLFVLVTADYRWWLGFINPEWAFKPNVKTPVRLRLEDGGTSLDRQAIIPNGQLMLIPLPDSPRLVDGFRHSSWLALETEGRSFFFRLREIPAVMDGLTSCIRVSLELKDKLPTADHSRGQEKDASAKVGSAPAVNQSTVSGVAVSPSTARSPSPNPSPKTAVSAPPPQSTATPAPGAPSAAESPPASATTAIASAAASSKSAPVPGGELAPAGPGSTAAPASTAKVAVPPNPMEALHPAVAEGSPAPSPFVTHPAATKPTSPPPSASMASRDAEGAPGGPAKFRVSSAAPQVAPATTDRADATSQATNPTAAPPPLAFTTVTPVMPTPPAFVLPSEPEPAAATEEVRLATHFLARARLVDAHIVNVDKPPALEQFAAVWRSEDAAGAVKIVPPGPNVSAIGIASNLITVDPQICKGDFAAARFRTDFGHRAVFSAVLSCGKGNEQRVTEYFVAPRDRGGFVVFAVIRSKALGVPDFDRAVIDGLSRAAIEAAEGQS